MSSLFVNQDILSVRQFDVPMIDQLFALTDRVASLKASRKLSRGLEGYVLGNLFFEASTRSRMSFTSAFSYLGGRVNNTTGVTFSSMAKGESLEDTIRVIQSYCDVVVMRHPELGSAAIAAEVSDVPLINAGDGAGEHPTQALLDLYTIYQEKGRLDGLTVTMVGDLRFGRTVHSLARLLCLYKDVRFVFAAPDVVQMPESIVAEIRDLGFTVELTDDFDAAIAQADVIYSTRIQRERYSNPDDYAAFDGVFVLNRDKIERICRPGVRILHPLPRTNEIAVDVDDLAQAAYFRQAENGLVVRMALFLLVLGIDVESEVARAQA